MSTKYNKITIEYGPYEIYGVIEHRETRLYNLMNKLNQAEFEVKLEKIEALDRVIIKMGGYEIFRCRLSFLHFQTSPQIDIIMERGLHASIDARARFKLAEKKFAIKQCIDQ